MQAEEKGSLMTELGLIDYSKGGRAMRSVISRIVRSWNDAG